MHTELTGSLRHRLIGRLDSRRVEYVHDHGKTTAARCRTNRRPIRRPQRDLRALRLLYMKAC